MSRQWSLSFWVGAFVAGAVLIAVIGLIVIGGGHWFRDSSRVVLYFNESVHNLEVGAAVKINGVRAGRVDTIAVLFDEEEVLTRAQVVFVLDRIRLIDNQGRPFDLSEPGRLERLVEEGLRARLALTGITGLLYVDLFIPSEPGEARLFDGGLTNFAEIPTRSSPLSELSETVTETIANLSQIDFALLADDAHRLLQTLQSQMAGADLANRSAELGVLIEAITVQVESGKIPEILDLAAENMTIIRDFLTLFQADWQPLAGDLRASMQVITSTLQKWEEVAGEVQKFVAPESTVFRNLRDTLRRTSEAAGAIERLAEYLERHPEALIRGRNPGATFP